MWEGVAKKLGRGEGSPIPIDRRRPQFRSGIGDNKGHNSWQVEGSSGSNSNNHHHPPHCE